MKYSKLLSALLVGIACTVSAKGAAEDWPKKICVTEPVVDLRIKLYHETNPVKDEERVTQLLYGEKLIAYEEVAGWYHVKTVEQSQLSKGDPDGLEGWILNSHVTEVVDFAPHTLVVTSPHGKMYPTEDVGGGMVYLSMGTYLRADHLKLGWWTVHQPDGSLAYVQDCYVAAVDALAQLPETSLRQSIADLGSKFVGTLYLRNGLSFYNPHWTSQKTGVDASGLIHLIYRAHDISIPRFLADQYALAKVVKDEPRKGDLIFLVDADSGTPVHVMLMLHDDLLLEASGVSNDVRTVTATERLGDPIHYFHSGDKVRNGLNYCVQFASFISK